MASQIELYEGIASLSAEMVSAARDQDWERLVSLEHEAARLRDRLMGQESGREGPPAGEDVARKRALIHQILNDDAEIRRYTEPWMEHVRQFLGGQNLRRQVVDAYAAGAGQTGTVGFRG